MEDEARQHTSSERVWVGHGESLIWLGFPPAFFFYFFFSFFLPSDRKHYLMQKHRGQVNATSRASGHGTTPREASPVLLLCTAAAKPGRPRDGAQLAALPKESARASA